MSKDNPSRRDVLKGSLATTMLGSAGVLAGCGKKSRGHRDDSQFRAVSEPLKPDMHADMAMLVLALGPWQARDRSVANGFIERYVVAGRMANFASDAATLGALAARFPDNAMAVEDIDLSAYSPAERALLLRFVEDLYSISELRYYITGHLPPGVCAP